MGEILTIIKLFSPTFSTICRFVEIDYGQGFDYFFSCSANLEKFIYYAYILILSYKCRAYLCYLAIFCLARPDSMAF